MYSAAQTPLQTPATTRIPTQRTNPPMGSPQTHALRRPPWGPVDRPSERSASATRFQVIPVRGGTADLRAAPPSMAQPSDVLGKPCPGRSAAAVARVLLPTRL